MKDLNKPEHIDIISDDNKSLDVKSYLKNPILITLNEKILKEKDLQRTILAKLKNFFSELGQGYALIGNEYKIKYGNKNYYIDLLLFNVELNCYVIVELKTRELRKEDKAQIDFFMNLVNNTLKRSFHNKTIGIIVSKEQDRYIVSFVSNEKIFPITYKLVNN